MTDDEIMAHWQLAEGTTDMRADLMSFARAIIAQARAEMRAELKPVAVATVKPGPGGGLNMDSIHDGWPYLFDDPRIDRGGVPLAIIPKE
jgi:hypothetical protein